MTLLKRSQVHFHSSGSLICFFDDTMCILKTESDNLNFIKAVFLILNHTGSTSHIRQDSDIFYKSSSHHYKHVICKVFQEFKSKNKTGAPELIRI